MSNPRPIRIIAKRNQTCLVCRQQISKGECLVVIPGGVPGGAHKGCEVDLTVQEIARREKTSERMMGNRFGSGS